MDYSEELLRRAKSIRALALDCDGVLFTGRVFIHPKDGEVLKERSYVDGQGISLLRAAGICIALVTGEESPFVEQYAAKMNGLPSVVSGQWPKIEIMLGRQAEGKAEAIGEWLERNGIGWEECAAMGDDISDMALLQKAGFAACPVNAEGEIKKIAAWTAPRRGGDGAIRDLANLLLQARSIDLGKSVLR